MSAVVAWLKVTAHFTEDLHDLHIGTQRLGFSPYLYGRVNWRVETHCFTARTPIIWIGRTLVRATQHCPEI